MLRYCWCWNISITQRARPKVAQAKIKLEWPRTRGRMKKYLNFILMPQYHQGLCNTIFACYMLWKRCTPKNEREKQFHSSPLFYLQSLFQIWNSQKLKFHAFQQENDKNGEIFYSLQSYITSQGSFSADLPKPA